MPFTAIGSTIYMAVEWDEDIDRFVSTELPIEMISLRSTGLTSAGAQVCKKECWIVWTWTNFATFKIGLSSKRRNTEEQTIFPPT